MNSNLNTQIQLPSGVVTTLQGNQNGLYALIIWAEEMNRVCIGQDKIIMAAVGRPTAPLYGPIKEANYIYWNKLDKHKSIEYGEVGRGQLEHRERIAKAFTADYNTLIDKENIVFTVGGKSAINAWSYLFKTVNPGKKLVISAPYYPDHLGVSEFGLNHDNLVLIDTLEDPKGDYRLNAEKIETALKDIEPNEVGAFVFCDPCNPMGYTIGEQEWRKISKLLLKYTNAMVILDEAYAEMVFDAKHVSLLSIASDELKSRIVLLRSATKGLSAAGERYAVIMAFNPVYIELLAYFNDTNLIHAPISSQYVYSYAIEKLTLSDRLQLANFYRKFIVDVNNLLNETHFNFKQAIPIDSTFYLIGDFKKLIGHKLDKNALSRVYCANPAKKLIETDVDIAYHLLFKYKIAFCPLSFFGACPKKGLLRITCSFVGDEFEILATRLKRVQKDHHQEKPRRAIESLFNKSNVRLFESGELDFQSFEQYSI